MNNDQEELLVVVDKNDNILDYLPRSEVHKQKLLHRTVGISIFNDKGEILLQKRSSKKDNNPSKLANAAGGHVTKDKNYDQTAKEELKEELGIEIDLIFIRKMFIDDPVHNTMTSIYKAFSNGPFKIDSEEIDEIKFYSKEELQKVRDQLSESAKIVLSLQGMI